MNQASGPYKIVPAQSTRVKSFTNPDKALDFVRIICINYTMEKRRAAMKLIYPAIFTPYFDEGGYDVSFPDLPKCMASGDSLEEALDNAANEASRYILTLMEKGEDVPPASDYADVVADDPDDFVNYVVLDMGAYSDAHAQKSVRKNITIPSWLNAYGEAHHVNFSKLLQESLLNMTQTRHNDSV